MFGGYIKVKKYRSPSTTLSVRHVQQVNVFLFIIILFTVIAYRYVYIVNYKYMFAAT